MKKTRLLNIALSQVIASLGHTDMLVIGDAGLPISDQTQRIDLALTAGIPGFADTLRVILTEMQVERAFVAAETQRTSSNVMMAIKELLPDTPIETISHEDLKAMSREARAVVRTGEFTPYANIILVSGVVF
ncbi:MAG TPA: D-ribose pyranase [Anaerolineales bacterium]|jgi:D-ribose pyranase|nr:D-ribose pyranase [Anaerolineales bacterium]